MPEIPSALSAGQKISNLFSLLTVSAAKGGNFDHLLRPFRAIATNLVNGEEVVLDGSQLSLAESIRASMAVLMVFAPVEVGEQFLVDGGLVKNLPVDIVKQMGADIVIAVNVSSPLRKKEELQSLFAIMDQTISLQIVHSTEKQLALADLVLTPELTEFSSADFPRAVEIIARGEASARAQSEHLRRIAALLPTPPSVPPPALPVDLTAPGEPQIQIERVILAGNVSAHDLSLLKELGLKRGQTLTASKLAERIERVFGAGFFESVKFSLEPGAAGGHIVRIEAKERELNLLRVGARYDDKSSGVGLAGIAIKPWWEHNTLLSADVEFGGVTSVQASYLRYRLFDSDLFLQPRAFYRDDFQQIFANHKKIGEFKNRASGFEFALGNNFRNVGEVIARYQWRTVSFVPNKKRRGLSRVSGKLAGVGLSTRLDTLDAFPFPRAGSSVSFSANWMNTVFGGDRNFARLYCGYTQYLTLWQRHTFAYGVRLGSSAGTRMPVSEEFWFGGPDTFVGYAREELRGAHLGVARLDYRYKVLDLPTGVGEGVYFHLAFNTGNVWRSLHDVEKRFRLRYGGGVGASVDSVIGPLTVGYGRGDEDQDEVYVSLGVPF